MAVNRRLGAGKSKSRTQLIDAADVIMSEEGYHAISARRVAERAGLKPQLVHYYFETMDDLILAVFHRTNDQYFECLEQALSSPQPLRALWALNVNRSDTKRSLEFIAFASHREAMRAEIVQVGERARDRQIEAVSEILKRHGVEKEIFSAAAFVMLMAAISRALVLENTLGMTMAHEELTALVNHVLDQMEPRPAAEEAALDVRSDLCAAPR